MSLFRPHPRKGHTALSVKEVLVIDGDRAIELPDQDKLGFRDVAIQIANAVVARSTAEGLVISIEGEWGSGKSSLLNLVAAELGKLPDANRPTTISFQPWLIGNRDALIAKLFDELFKGLKLVATSKGDHRSANAEEAQKAIDALEKFVGVLCKSGSLIEIVGDASAIAPLKWSGKILKALGGMVGGRKADPQLSDLKSQLDIALRKLDHRFIIMVDDLDRLEPKEAIEVLRLVRSVVDLPNIVYLLSFDGDILAHNIRQVSGVQDGQAYLEKIVQLTIPVPKPEQFQLRQWFSEELSQIANVKNEDERTRLVSIIDTEGVRQLRTPRAVTRSLDAMRFIWPALQPLDIDLADLVWLQLIKTGNPRLYRWIEDYCLAATALSLGTVRIADSTKKSELAKLIELNNDDYFSDEYYRFAFAEQLPGLEANFQENGPLFELFTHVNEPTRDDSIRKKRLASPDHSRLFFSLKLPSHALDGTDFRSFWQAINEGPSETGKALISLCQKHSSGSLSKGDILLERLAGETHNIIESEQAKHISVALSDRMDEAYKLNPLEAFAFRTLWDRALRLMPLLLKSLEPETRSETVNNLFSEGAALSWLTHVFRREIFAHGRFGDRERLPQDWLFSDEELDTITSIMLQRYQKMTKLEFFETPTPISLLFAWKQGGDANGARQFVEGNIQTDKELVEMLEHLSSTVSSSDRGLYHVLKEENLSPFLVYDVVQARVLSLTTHPDLGKRAEDLAEQFRLATE